MWLELSLFFLATVFGIVVALLCRKHRHVEVLLSIYLFCAAFFMYEGTFSWLAGNSTP